VVASTEAAPHHARQRCATWFHTNLAIRRINKDAFPRNPVHATGCAESFSLPKQAQICRVSFQAQYQAFVRFAVGSGAAL